MFTKLSEEKEVSLQYGKGLKRLMLNFNFGCCRCADCFGWLHCFGCFTRWHCIGYHCFLLVAVVIVGRI